MRLVEHEVYAEMYYVEWEDGIRSEMFYNKTRATEFLNRLNGGENEREVKVGYTLRN